MLKHTEWLDKDNPTTNAGELSSEDLIGLKEDFKTDLENLMDEYEKVGLDYGEQKDVVNEFF